MDLHRSDEKILDIKDLIVELLHGCKSVILITILFTVLVGCFGVWRAWKNNHFEDNGKSAEERIEEAREKLSDAELQEVEQLYDRYKLYTDYRAQYLEKFNGFLLSSGDVKQDNMVKRVIYSFSSNIEAANSIMSFSSLELDDYKEIMEILPNAETIEEAYNYVTLYSIVNNKIQVTNMGDSSNSIPLNYLLIVEVIGDTKEISDQVAEVVENALRRKIKELKKVDTDISLEKISSNYLSNVSDYIAQRRQSSYDYINRLDNSINSLTTYNIDKLSETKREYFNLLKDPDYGSDLKRGSEVQPLINKKLIIFGFLLGLFASFSLIFLRYIISDTIKVPAEIETYYNLSVIESFFIPQKEKGLLSGVIKKIIGSESLGREAKAKLAAVDICGIMRENGEDSLFIFQTVDCKEDRYISSIISNAVSNLNSDAHLDTGLALMKQEKMQNALNSKNVLLLVHCKKTVRSEVEKILDICKRHKVNVIGAVMLIEC